MGYNQTVKNSKYVNIHISTVTGKLTKLSIDGEKYHLNSSELRSLEYQARKAVYQSNDSPEAIDHPTRLNDIDIGMKFDERVLFDALVEINRVGEATALNVLEQIVIKSLDEITKGDIINTSGVSEKTADKIWLYLRGFYDGTIEDSHLSS